jgi:hypothetical protein
MNIENSIMKSDGKKMQNKLEKLGEMKNNNK